MSILGRKLTFIFLLVSSLLSPQGYAQLQIVITQGVDNPVQIAIVPFDWNGFGLLEENVTDIVSANLRNSGEFASIAEENMLSTPHEQADVFFRDWRFLGADYLLIGKINDTGAGSAFQVQYELFDVLREERIFDEFLPF